MTSAADRPTGVTVMAAVAGLTGVVDILTGLGDIGIAEASSATTVSGTPSTGS